MENNRHLQFVLKHYHEGAFDTSKAIGKFKKATGRPDRRFIRYIAGIAAAVIAGIFIFNPQPQPVHFMTADATETFILPDSTSVTLAPNSSLEFDARAYMRKSRSVRMEGKAFFDVTRNEKNPFEITMANAYVKVLGTSFQVDETSDAEVYVKSGKVLFAAAEEADGVILTKGMEAVLKLAGGGIPSFTESVTPNPVAWATGLFEYEATPLAAVLDELSEYYGVQLRASDYDRKLTAKFETGASVDDIIEMIEAATEITITK